MRSMYRLPHRSSGRSASMSDAPNAVSEYSTRPPTPGDDPEVLQLVEQFADPSRLPSDAAVPRMRSRLVASAGSI